MKVMPIKTEKIMPKSTSITSLCDRFITKLNNKTILAISSKAVALCEGAIMSQKEVSKYELAKKEADYYLPKTANKYGYMASIKNGVLISSAGIDMANGNGYYVLWPQNPQQSANDLRLHLQKKFRVNDIGVIITDSISRPLLRGITGFALAHSGFAALKDYRGQTDTFGYKLKGTTKVNVACSLASSAVITMGEGNEQTPLALIEDVPFVVFQDRNPRNDELDELYITMENDLFAPLLLSAPWIKGEA